MTADPLRALPDKWRETALRIAKPYGFVTEQTLGRASAMEACADQLSDALSQAGVVNGEQALVGTSDFDRWFNGSKYMQVVYSNQNVRQVALDGWSAALDRMAEEHMRKAYEPDDYADAFNGREELADVVVGEGWYCPICKCGVAPSDVTYEETHDPRAGGCGHSVAPQSTAPINTTEPEVPLCDNPSGLWCKQCRGCRELGIGMTHCSDPINCGDMEPMAHHDDCPHTKGDTGVKEADRLINRLMSSDPNYQDCSDAAALIRQYAMLAAAPAAQGVCKVHGRDWVGGCSYCAGALPAKTLQPISAHVQALSFYADQGNFDRAERADGNGYAASKVDLDDGKLAREALAAAPAVVVDEAMVERAARAMARVRVPLVDDDNDEIPVVDALAGALGDDDIGRAQEVLWSMANDALAAALGQEVLNGGR